MGPLACAVSPGLAMQVGKCRGVWQRWATCGGRRHDVTSAQTAGVPSIKNSMVLGKCSVCVGGGAARVSFWHPCSGSGQLQIHTSWGGSGEGLRGLTYAGEICRGPQAAVPTH